MQKSTTDTERMQQLATDTDIGLATKCNATDLVSSKNNYEPFWPNVTLKRLLPFGFISTSLLCSNIFLF